jgi:hypothetical protein
MKCQTLPYQNQLSYSDRRGQKLHTSPNKLYQKHRMARLRRRRRSPQCCSLRMYRKTMEGGKPGTRQNNKHT